MNNTPTPAAAESLCCARFYELDWVQRILGESFHPGGIALTECLIRSLQLPAKSNVLDIACGIGTTARLIVEKFHYNVIGLDASERNTAKARELSQRIVDHEQSLYFVTRSAETLPFANASFDAVICECAVSTIPDQPRVFAEMVRVLKPGGVIGISDMVIEGTLPNDIVTKLAPWTCLVSARSVVGYQMLALQAGLRVVESVDESVALREFIVELKRKLIMLGLSQAIGTIPGMENMDWKAMSALLQRASEFVRNGTIQYTRMTFAQGKPRYPETTRPERSSKIVDLFCDPSTGCCQAG